MGYINVLRIWILRLSISDLYLAFCEFNMTEAAQTYANTIDYNVYRVLSDFRLIDICLSEQITMQVYKWHQC